MNGQKILFLLEAVALFLVFALFRALPLDAASALGGWIGRTIGYRLPQTQRARRNLERFMPELSRDGREAVLRDMWDNLGRNAGEYPHLREFRFGPGERVEIVGIENVRELMADDLPSLFLSAHIGNWELNAFAAQAHGIPVHLVYRAANNPYTEWIYRYGRANAGIELMAKGARGARRVLVMMKNNGNIGILVDQKMNDGIAVPFFGYPAMTAPAVAELATKFRCPAIPVHVVRLKGARFQVIVEKQLDLPTGSDRKDATLEMMTEINRRVECWIRENPGQWLWLHRRWPEESWKKTEA